MHLETWLKMDAGFRIEHREAIERCFDALMASSGRSGRCDLLSPD